MKHSVTEVKLANGVSGLLIHVPEASVMNIEFNFRAGEYLVEKKKWETPHLMEHVLLGANAQHPKARLFQAEFEKNGAYNNASTGPYDITYEAECADFEWDRILKLMQIAISQPLFLEEEFQSEFSNVKEELTSRANSHYRHLSLALRQSFGFLALTDKERLKLMKNVSVEDVKQHYERTHTLKNMRFVIAGKLPFRRRRVIKQLLEAMDLPQGEQRFPLPQEVPHTLKKPLYIHNESVDNLYFYLDTFMLRRMRDPETDALNLVNTMLTETLNSRILGAAREKGLVYGMNSGAGQSAYATNWWFGAQVTANNAKPLFALMKKELQRIFKGEISEEDVTAAKQYALGKYQRSGQTVLGTATGYSQRYFFDELVDDYYKVPERIRAVSRNRITAITKSLFDDNVWGLGVLGSSGQEQATALRSEIASLWK
jgi:predicted Zn-dependent peptidase